MLSKGLARLDEAALGKAEMGSLQSRRAGALAIGAAALIGRRREGVGGQNALGLEGPHTPRENFANF